MTPRVIDMPNRLGSPQARSQDELVAELSTSIDTALLAADRAADASRRLDTAIRAASAKGGEAAVIALRALRQGEAAALADWLASAVKPASPAEIRGHLLVLIARIPSAEGKNLGPLSTGLATEIGRRNPPIGALTATMSALWCSKTFVPSIEEALSELKRQTEMLAARAQVLDRLAATLAHHETRLARLREPDPKAMAEVTRRLERGKDLSLCDPALVAEARKRLPVTGSEDW